MNYLSRFPDGRSENGKMNVTKKFQILIVPFEGNVPNAFWGYLKNTFGFYCAAKGRMMIPAAPFMRLGQGISGIGILNIWRQPILVTKMPCSLKF